MQGSATLTVVGALLVAACTGSSGTTTSVPSSVPRTIAPAVSSASTVVVTTAVASGTMVGPDGGVVQSDDGSLTVDIPAGAVSANTPIELTSVAPPPGVEAVAIAAYRLEPAGTVFDVPLSVRLKTELGAPDRLPLLLPFIVSEGSWELPETAGMSGAAGDLVVSVTTSHFSDLVFLASPTMSLWLSSSVPDPGLPSGGLAVVNVGFDAPELSQVAVSEAVFDLPVVVEELGAAPGGRSLRCAQPGGGFITVDTSAALDRDDVLAVVADLVPSEPTIDDDFEFAIAAALEVDRPDLCVQPLLPIGVQGSTTIDVQISSGDAAVCGQGFSDVIVFVNQPGPGYDGLIFFAVEQQLDLPGRQFFFDGDRFIVDSHEGVLGDELFFIEDWVGSITTSEIFISQVLVREDDAVCVYEGSLGELPTFPSTLVDTPAPVAPEPACQPADFDACLGGRFGIEVTPAGAFTAHQGTGAGADIGEFWFFSPANIDMVVKVLNGCDVNDHYWVFAATRTSVEMTITDTATGDVARWANPLGATAEPILDTEAFATCP